MTDANVWQYSAIRARARFTCAGEMRQPKCKRRILGCAVRTTRDIAYLLVGLFGGGAAAADLVSASA